MKAHYVRTENMDLLEAGLAMLDLRGSREASWMLVTGRPGEGKTTTLYNWGARQGAVFVTMRPGMTPTRLINEVATKLGIRQGGDVDLDTAVQRLVTEKETAIVLDEAGHALADREACLERLRWITDKSLTPLVLVAMAQDIARFDRRQQISSRIYNHVEFKPTTLDDLVAVVLSLAEVEIDADLIARIHRETAGRMRLVLNAISRIEAVGKSLGKDRVTAADMARTRLCEDYRRTVAPRRAA